MYKGGGGWVFGNLGTRPEASGGHTAPIPHSAPLYAHPGGYTHKNYSWTHLTCPLLSLSEFLLTVRCQLFPGLLKLKGHDFR